MTEAASDRDRARSFGSVAEDYDRARPTYPGELIDDLVAGGTPSVLDIGCGTGKAAELFIARGCSVVGVEADSRMADVARRKGIAVEVSDFERWDARDRRFDLVVSAQAWHWMDPDVAPAKAADTLWPGGRLALFWNIGRHDPDVRAALTIARTYETGVRHARRETQVVAAEAAHNASIDALGDVGVLILDAPARSLAGLAVKARVVKTWGKPDWWDPIEGRADTYERLAAEILDAVVAMAEGQLKRRTG